jgi:hypothetical protein
MQSKSGLAQKQSALRLPAITASRAMPAALQERRRAPNSLPFDFLPSHITTRTTIHRYPSPQFNSTHPPHLINIQNRVFSPHQPLKWLPRPQPYVATRAIASILACAVTDSHHRRLPHPPQARRPQAKHQLRRRMPARRPQQHLVTRRSAPRPARKPTPHTSTRVRNHHFRLASSMTHFTDHYVQSSSKSTQTLVFPTAPCPSSTPS